MKRYTLFDLNLASDFDLPELVVPETGQVDVIIRRTEVVSGGGGYLAINGVADFAVTDGRLIEVAPAANCAEGALRPYLLGTAMGILLHQRQWLPLHANSIVRNGMAVAFLGESGAGKSTLAAWMGNHGCSILADDVCAVDFDAGGAAWALPGVPRLRLCGDVLEPLGRDRENLRRSFPDDPDFEKFDLPLAPNLAAPRKSALAAIYLLERGQDFSVEPLSGLDAVDALFAHTYRGEYVMEYGDPLAHWKQCLALAAGVPMFIVRRTFALAVMDVENRAILGHVDRAITANCGS